MGTSPVAKQTHVADSRDCTQDEPSVLELLLEENRYLREAAKAFGELAERLNLELQEARRSHSSVSFRSGIRSQAPIVRLAVHRNSC